MNQLENIQNLKRSDFNKLETEGNIVGPIKPEKNIKYMQTAASRENRIIFSILTSLQYNENSQIVKSVRNTNIGKC